MEQKGLAYIKINDDGPSSPIIKFLGKEVTRKVIEGNQSLNWRHYIFWC